MSSPLAIQMPMNANCRKKSFTFSLLVEKCFGKEIGNMLIALNLAKLERFGPILNCGARLLCNRLRYQCQLAREVKSVFLIVFVCLK